MRSPTLSGVVIHSLMPKGVEHMDKGGGFVSRLGRDSFVDAERR